MAIDNAPFKGISLRCQDLPRVKSASPVLGSPTEDHGTVGRAGRSTSSSTAGRNNSSDERGRRRGSRGFITWPRRAHHSCGAKRLVAVENFRPPVRRVGTRGWAFHFRRNPEPRTRAHRRLRGGEATLCPLAITEASLRDSGEEPRRHRVSGANRSPKGRRTLTGDRSIAAGRRSPGPARKLIGW